MGLALDPSLRLAAQRVADWHRMREMDHWRRFGAQIYAQIVPPEPPVAPPPPPPPPAVPPIVDPVTPGDNRPVQDPPVQPAQAAANATTLQ